MGLQHIGRTLQALAPHLMPRHSHNLLRCTLHATSLTHLLTRLRTAPPSTPSLHIPSTALTPSASNATTSYTEDKESQPDMQARAAWTQISSSTFSRAIAKWGEDLECAHEFMQMVRSELLGTRVFVFTEKGRSTRILNLVSCCMRTRVLWGHRPKVAAACVHAYACFGGIGLI